MNQRSESLGRQLENLPLEECLESMESVDSSSVDESSSDNDSSALADDSSSSSSDYSFDFAELEGDLSQVLLSASKRLMRSHDDDSSRQWEMSPKIRKCMSCLHVNSNDSDAQPPIPKSQSFACFTNSVIDSDNGRTMASIREDLLKLGSAILSSRKGDALRERALVLASINYLASNVPCCVLDHLGREVRQAENRSVLQDQSTPSTASYSSSSITSGSTDDWDNSCCFIDEDTKSEHRSLTKFHSLDSEEGVILDLPYVAPFQGVVLFGTPRRDSQ